MSAGRIAVVLPGGGARGAYEVGALEVLIPALEARGERVTVWCGTSVGAINAVAMASRAQLSAADQIDEVSGVWEGLRKRDVLAPLVGIGGARMVVRAVGHAVGLSGARLASLLDPTPLTASLERWIDWGALPRNVRSGVVEAVCVVATQLSSGQPVGFVAGRGPVPAAADDSIRYVKTRLRGEHVRASAAIPVLFPTVEVTTPRAARGHYTDGGTRLNSAIKPAIDLGADRVVLIGFEPFLRRPGGGAMDRAPSIADVVANVLDGLLVDQVAADLRRLAAINSFFAETPSTGTNSSARAYRLARGHAPYRLISYALVAPERRGEIARLAEGTFERRYGGMRGRHDLDFALIARLLGTATRSRGELLSFLLFDAEFTRALMDMGRRDARRWLRRHPRFWCHEARHDLSLGDTNGSRVLEDGAIDEFRAQRRL